MSISESDITFVRELFAEIGQISHRKMMGGLAVYHNEVIFALVSSDGQIFLKARDAFAKRMAQAGSRQFGQDHGRKMPYWTLPDSCLDDPGLACDWARDALRALEK